MPASTFISVDLPAPFSPISACTSPAISSKRQLSSARTPGNDLLRLWIETSGSIHQPPPRVVVTSCSHRDRADRTHLYGVCLGGSAPPRRVLRGSCALLYWFRSRRGAR